MRWSAVSRPGHDSDDFPTRVSGDTLPDAPHSNDSDHRSVSRHRPARFASRGLRISSVRFKPSEPACAPAELSAHNQDCHDELLDDELLNKVSPPPAACASAEAERIRAHPGYPSEAA
jgi:hypothetical protein